MVNVIIVAVLLAIVAAAARYVYKEKKRGVKCVGCPDGCCCSQNGGCGCGKGTNA